MRRLILTTSLFLLLPACGSSSSDNDVLASNFVPPTLIKRAEFETLLEARYTRLDRNLDGAIDAAEIPARYAARLKSLDADHDGRITHREFISGSLARFDREDTNHDGMLTNVESAAARTSEKAAALAN